MARFSQKGNAEAVKMLMDSRHTNHPAIGPDGSYVLYKKKESVIEKRKETVAKQKKKEKKNEKNIAKHISDGYKHTDDTDEPFKRVAARPLKRRTAAEIKEAGGRRNKANAKASAEARAEKAKADAEKAKAEKVKAAANRRKARGKAMNKAVSGERRLSF
jgi:hypothetical protein